LALPSTIIARKLLSHPPERLRVSFDLMCAICYL
jgi:hypothetical protein